ncbi:MerR family transcriptional regulator [Pseudokineococcus sp. 1T1Z-3]|uniref:MerR family transcriptional regulator n=1 Tax=Pseudokineococcus sp. 1T1Z-3 TaxID=3132745 RepID=UPI0030A2003F
MPSQEDDADTADLGADRGADLGTGSSARAGAPTLKVAAVARRLGVAPATLRTWARRYGLGPSAHTAGAHRQYSLGDLDRLMVMRRMTLEGYSPAEAARVALQTPSPPPAPTGAPRPAVPQGDRHGVEGPTSAPPSSSPVRSSPVQSPAPVGDAQPALGSATPSVRSLARAAMALQAGECARQLEAYAAVDGVVRTWTALVRPVLQVLSDRVGAVSPGRAPGALLEAALLQALRSIAEGSPAGGAGALVVRPCTAEEDADARAAAHRGAPAGVTGDLLGHVLAAALGEAGVRASVLPGAHPAERAAAVAEQVDAAVVLVVADADVPRGAREETARLVDPLGARVLLVGRGWAGEAPDGARVVADLGDAVDAVTG